MTNQQGDTSPPPLESVPAGHIALTSRLGRAFLDTLFFWVFALVYSFIATRVSKTSPISPRIDVVVGLVFSLLASLWVAMDARKRKWPMGYGFPALVFFIWPIFATIYLFQTRGAWALLSLLLFAAMFFFFSAIGTSIGVVILPGKRGREMNQLNLEIG